MIAYAILIAEMTSFFTFDGQILPQEHVTRLDQNMQSGEFEFKIGSEKNWKPWFCARNKPDYEYLFLLMSREHFRYFPWSHGSDRAKFFSSRNFPPALKQKKKDCLQKQARDCP